MSTSPFAPPAIVLSEREYRNVEIEQTALAWLEPTHWFDKRLVGVFLSHNTQLHLGLASTNSVAVESPDAFVARLRSRSLCERSIPVGYRLSAEGQSVARYIVSQLPEETLEKLRFHLAVTLISLLRRGGGLRARRTLAEAARLAGLVESEGLVVSTLHEAARYARAGHLDLVPLVISLLFDDGEDAVAVTSEQLISQLEAALGRCNEREWDAAADVLASFLRWSRPVVHSSRGVQTPRRGSPVVRMQELLQAGVHWGSSSRHWNPKMRRFIFGERNGHYVIDLQQTLRRIETAYTFVRDLVADGGTILFIGTKKQAQDPIQSYAEKCGMPYINQRWLGGMLTNFETIAKRINKMAEYQRMRDSGEFEAMPKKEALLISRELEKLERNLGGIKKMTKLPDAVFILDTKKEHIGVTEANKLGLPIVAVVDTDCDPDVVQYVIPGNDDAIRSTGLLCRIIADAVNEGRLIASRRAAKGAAPGAEPPARTIEQEAESLRQAEQAYAAREARLAAARHQALMEQQAESTEDPGKHD